VIGRGMFLDYDFGIPFIVAFTLCVAAGARFVGGGALREATGGLRVGPYGMVAIWTMLVFPVVAWKLSSDWGRYYVPFIMPICVLAGIGFDRMVSALEELGNASISRRKRGQYATRSS
jgi:hypothetical protein